MRDLQFCSRKQQIKNIIIWILLSCINLVLTARLAWDVLYSIGQAIESIRVMKGGKQNDA